MKPILLVALLTALVIAGAADARAQARHERVQISEMKSGGKVVGARIKLTLRSEGQNWKDVLIGIGPSKGINNASNITAYRKLASDTSAGHLIHQFKPIAKPGAAQEVTLELKYADVPQLKPGESIQIISAWRPTSGDSVHAWGLTRYQITEQTYKLPGKANAQEQQLARRTSKRAATKTSKRAATRSKQAAATRSKQAAATRSKKSVATVTKSHARSSLVTNIPLGAARHLRASGTKGVRHRGAGQSASQRRAVRKARPTRARKAR